MGIGEIMMIETAIVIGALLVVAAVAGLMFLANYLKKKEVVTSMDMMKEKLFPEMEAMTNRMMENVINKTIEASVEMTKRLTEND